MAESQSPIVRLTDTAEFQVEGRPLVRSGDTINALPPHQVRVRHGKILAAEPLRSLPGATPRRACPFLLPGLADPHVHLVAMASRRLQGSRLPDGPYALQDFLAHVATVAAADAGFWVRLEGFEEADLNEGTLPTLADLDAACPDRPLRVRHASRHASLLNSKGRHWLQRQGWPDAFGPGPLVVGREMELARFLPRFETDRLRGALREVGEALLEAGITCVDDVTASNDLERLELLESAALPQHIRFWLGVDADWEAAMSRRSPVGIAGVKLLPQDADAVQAPWFGESVARARRAGYPLAIHAVEPDAMASILEVLAAAPQRTSGGPPGLDRMEHASLCPPALVEALAASGLAVVTQPAFLFSRGARYRRQLEEPLRAWLYPVASLHQAGVPVAFSSDAPVATPGLGPALAAACGRGTGTLADFGEAERLSPGLAFAAQSQTHRLIRGESVSDRWFAPGEEANFVVLNRDPRPSGFADLQVAAAALPGQGGGR